MAYAISLRMRELGIRRALGATSGDILRLIGGYGLRVTLAGVVAGLAGAWMGTVVLRDLLFEVRPTDPIVFAATTLLLAIIALSACIVPARRALSISPVGALRGD
jgi:putative ABC transport system permease protein